LQYKSSFEGINKRETDTVKIFIEFCRSYLFNLLLDSFQPILGNKIMKAIKSYKLLRAIWSYLLISFYFTVFLPLCCMSSKTANRPDDISFVLIGNTRPESPFCSLSGRLTLAFDEINRENPIFAVHMGDIIYGGKAWTGIKENDLTRQLREFYSIKISPILYNVMGDMDLLNDSAEIYTKYTNRVRYYSFNYGNLHFIVLDTTDPEPGMVSDTQINWLSDDLESSKNFSAIFIFTHHPMLIPKYAQMAESGEICKSPEKLFSIFAKYPVKAVFSGHLTSYYIEKRDDIFYITSGCGGYNKSDQYSNTYQYYIVRYNKGLIRIYEKRIPPGRGL
jgi:hypothetical protein